MQAVWILVIDVGGGSGGGWWWSKEVVVVAVFLFSGCLGEPHNRSSQPQ